LSRQQKMVFPFFPLPPLWPSPPFLPSDSDKVLLFISVPPLHGFSFLLFSSRHLSFVLPCSPLPPLMYPPPFSVTISTMNSPLFGSNEFRARFRRKLVSLPPCLSLNIFPFFLFHRSSSFEPAPPCDFFLFYFVFEFCKRCPFLPLSRFYVSFFILTP